MRTTPIRCPSIAPYPCWTVKHRARRGQCRPIGDFTALALPGDVTAQLHAPVPTSIRQRLPRTAPSRLPGGYHSNQTVLVSDTAALLKPGVTEGLECRLYRQFVAATRSMNDGAMRLAGGLENPATLRKRVAMTVSVSAAACTRSTYLLVSRIDSGRGPWTSGRLRSPPTASCQATPTGLAAAEKYRAAKRSAPPRKQRSRAMACSAATVMPWP